MSSLADLYCVLNREARSLGGSYGELLGDLLGSASSGYGSDHSGYEHNSGGYSYNSYHECCPLVVDTKSVLSLLLLGAAATYLLQSVTHLCS